MAREESPAYQWFIKDWRSSGATRRMSFAERGVYREMLDQQWEDGSLPDDAGAVAELIAVTDAQTAEIHAAWTAVRRKFVTVEGEPGRMFNARLEKCRKEYRAFIRAKKKAGRTRAEHAARDAFGAFQQHASTPPAQRQQTSSSSPAGIQPSTASSSASASATSSAPASASAPALRAGEEPPLPTARSKRPIFTGQKLTVFEWMLDDCLKTLGQFANDFDLHEWFFTFDKYAYDNNLVVPKKDGGVWLQAQLLAEAQRRGLPLVIDSGPNKQIAAIQNMGREFLANDGRR